MCGLGVSVEGGVSGGEAGTAGGGGDEREVGERCAGGLVDGERGERSGGDGLGLRTELESRSEVENGASRRERPAGFEVVDVLADDVDVVGDGVADGEVGLGVTEVEEEDPVLDVEGIEVGGRRGGRVLVLVEEVQQPRDLHFSF